MFDKHAGLCVWLVAQMFVVGWSLTLKDGFPTDDGTKSVRDVDRSTFSCEDETIYSYSGAIVAGNCSSYASCYWIIHAQNSGYYTEDYGVMLAISNSQLHWADCIHVFPSNYSTYDTGPYTSYCGFQSSGTTYVNGLNWLEVHVAFRACGDWCYPGVKLLYTSDFACMKPRMLPLTSSWSFSSPFYPETYTRFLQCVWYIDVPSFQMMMLNFGYFDVGGSTTDPCDSMYGRFNITGDRVADLSYCNRNPPPPYLYLLGYGRYVFRLETGSLIPSVGQGFTASYQILDQSASTRSPGLKLSPDVNAPEKPDLLEQQVMTKNVGGLDHYYIPLNQSTASGQLINEERRRELSAMCNGENPITISNSSGVITSPDYPNSYPGSLDCSWRILPHQSDAEADYTGVFIAFNFFNLHWSDCVHVSTYSNTVPTTTNAFCGTFPSLPVTTYVSADAYVAFKSCSGNSFPGFRLYYTSDKACWSDQTLPQPTGTIQSPFYPNAPVQQLACRWVMTIPARQMMVLTFNEFNLAGPVSGACDPNYGSIVITASNVQPVTYCSSNRPTSELYLTGSMTFYYRAGSMIPPSTEVYLASYRVDLENTILCGTGVRLAGSSVSYQGRLEILYNGQWGTVCDQGFTDTQAAVACYSLGFGRAGSFIGNMYGPGSGPIWLSDVECSGNEACLGKCSHNNWGSSGCSHNNDVSITCKLNRCYTYGDPHYYTFDSKQMSYQGTCRYLMARPAQTEVSLPYFEVYSKSEHRSGQTSVSWPLYAEIIYNGDTVRLTRTGVGTQVIALVNGVQIQVPYTSLNQVYSIRYSGSYLRYETTFGLRVEFDGNLQINIYVPASYLANMYGFCGNNDGSSTNDLTLANGTYVGNKADAVNLVGDSFVVYDSEDPYRTCSYGPPPPPPCTPVPPSYVSRCGLLTDLNGPFGQCIASMDRNETNTAYDNCILDACFTNGASICDSLQVFADSCAENNVIVSCDLWQSAAGCTAVNCPAGMIYRCNSTACLATCTDPYAPDDCLQPNRPACVCPDGQILHNGVCVSECPIGCIDSTDSQFHPIGDQWPSKFNCSTLTCTYCADCPLNGRIDTIQGCRPFETCSGNVCIVPTTTTTPPTTSIPPTTDSPFPVLTRPYIAVQLNGSLVLTATLSFDCQEGYNDEFSDSFANVVGRVNSLINQGQLCTRGLVVMAGQSLLSQQETQGRVSMTLMVGINPPNHITIGNVESCSVQTANFVQNFQNWRQPIIPAIFGCPSSNFNPTVFDFRLSNWKMLY